MGEGAATFLEYVGAFFALLFFLGCIIAICAAPSLFRALRQPMPDTQSTEEEDPSSNLYVVH